MRLVIGCALAMIFSTSCVYAQSYVPDDSHGAKSDAGADVDYGALVYVEIFGHPPQRSAVKEATSAPKAKRANEVNEKLEPVGGKPGPRIASRADRAADAAVEVVADIERALNPDMAVDRDYRRETLEVTFLPAREPELPGGRNRTGIFLPRKLEAVEVPPSTAVRIDEQREDDLGG